MGTRMNLRITVEAKYRPEEEMMIYRHYDGYPESVMPDLLCLIQVHLQNPNLTAGKNVKRTLDYISSSVSGLLKRGFVSKEDEEPLPRLLNQYTSKISQYEMTDSLHGDIEYFYELELAPSFAKITVFDINYEAFRLPDGMIDWSVPMGERLREMQSFVFSPTDIMPADQIVMYLQQLPETYNCGHTFQETKQGQEAWRFVPEVWETTIDNRAW
jgi:hypothetical protein